MLTMLNQTSLTSPATRKQIRRAADLTEVALRDGFTQDEMQIIHGNGGAYQKEYLVFLRQFIQKFRQQFSVVVDYGMSLSHMISAGNYDWVNSDITAKHFPITGKGVKTEEVTLFHFNRDISFDKVIEKMDKAGYRPANVVELLALGAQNPKLQLDFPIVALDSVWRYSDGIRSVPVLRRRGSERELDLRYFEIVWDAIYRFAAVRKHSTL